MMAKVIGARLDRSDGGAFGEASTPKEFKDEIDPCEGKVQTLMGPRSGVTDGSRSEPAGTPA